MCASVPAIEVLLLSALWTLSGRSLDGLASGEGRSVGIHRDSGGLRRQPWKFDPGCVWPSPKPLDCQLLTVSPGHDRSIRLQECHTYLVSCVGVECLPLRGSARSSAAYVPPRKTRNKDLMYQTPPRCWTVRRKMCSLCSRSISGWWAEGFRPP